MNSKKTSKAKLKENSKMTTKTVFLREGRQFKFTYESEILPSEIGNQIITAGYRNVTVFRPVQRKFKALYLIFDEISNAPDDDDDDDDDDDNDDKSEGRTESRSESRSESKNEGKSEGKNEDSSDSGDSEDEGRIEQKFFFIGDNRKSDSFMDNKDMDFEHFHLRVILEEKSKNLVPIDINYEEFAYRSLCVKLTIPIVSGNISESELHSLQNSYLRLLTEEPVNNVLQGLVRTIEYMKYLTFAEIMIINRSVVTTENESDDECEEECEEGSDEKSDDDSGNESED
jgi:hypothetical protein